MADPISNTETKGALDVLAADALTAKTGTTARPTISNKDVLADMQKLYDQKLAEKNYFLQDMADAAAWWSGGAAGPSVGLALRAQTRAAQAKQLEDLQAQISQGKVNLAQLGEANEAMGAPSANVTGLTGGAPAGAQTTSPALPSGGYSIRGVPVPEVVYKAYQAYIKQGNLAKATEVFDTYNKEVTKGEIGFATNPAAYKQDDYYNEKTGEITGKNPLQIRSGMTPAAPAGASANAPSAATLGTNTQAAKEVGVPVTSGYRDQDKQAKLYAASQQPGYQGNPVAKPGESLHQTDEAIDVPDYRKLKPEQLKWLRENGYQQTMPDTDPNHFAKVPGTAKVSAPAPTATAPTTTGGVVPSYSEAKAKSAGEKSFQEKAQTKAGEASGTRQGAFESAAVDASKDLQNANVMLNIMDKHPEAVGFSYKNKALGTTIEGIKLLTGKDIEPVARRAALPPEAIEAGNKFDALAETNNLKFRQAVYKGTGQVSDFETKLSERASGLARDNSLEANRFFATVAAENYRTLDKLGKDWQAYQKSHPGAVFSQFEQSDTWKNAQAERENRLKKYFPEIERSDLGFGSRAPKKGAEDTEMESWRQRYGTQKGSQ
jgi:hypothetical protein